MSDFPVLSGKKLLRILSKNGFRPLRKKGSHVFVESSDGQWGTAVPIHGNEDLGKGLIHSILHDLELTTDDLTHMLRK